MKYVEKECKTFITKFIKLINGINKYNVESILLMQIYKTLDSFQPVIISKPIDVDIFEYLKTIYSDNEIYNRSLKYMDMDKIHKKIDKLYYTPVLFMSMKPVPFMNITENDLGDNNLLLPSKYNNLSSYSDSYFIVTDLFKDFVKERIITGVDDEMNFYDENDCKYDTSAFIYKNEINKSFESEFVEKTSPKHFLPYDINTKSKFIDNSIKEMLTELNSCAINREIKDLFAFRSNIGIIEENNIEIQKTNENIKQGKGTFYLNDDKHINKLMTFTEFFKINPKEIYFTKRNNKVNVDGITMSIVNAGICLKNKEFVLYLFYKYFETGMEMIYDQE